MGLADDIAAAKQQFESEKQQEKVELPQYNEFDFDINLAGSVKLILKPNHIVCGSVKVTIPLHHNLW